MVTRIDCVPLVRTLPLLQAEEEEVRLTALREAKLREKEAKKQKRRELLGDEYVSQDEDEVEEESEGYEGVEGAEGVEGQPPTKEEKVKVPGTILSSFYSHENEKNFWVSMVSVIIAHSRMGNRK